MSPFCLYDFYVIFLHRGQLWKTHVFFSLWRRSHARSPESRSCGTWCDPELLKELPGNGVQTVFFCISTWTCLAINLWAEFWAPIFNIYFKHVQTPVNWVVQKRLEAPHVPLSLVSCQTDEVIPKAFPSLQGLSLNPQAAVMDWKIPKLFRCYLRS